MSQYYNPPQTYKDLQTLTALDLNNDTAAIKTAFTNLEADLSTTGGGDWVARFGSNGIYNADMRVWHEGNTVTAADEAMTAEMFFSRRSASPTFTETLWRVGHSPIPLPMVAINALQITNTSSPVIAPGNDDFAAVQYRMEGNDFRRFYGQRSTLCFYAYAEVVGKYSVVISNNVDRFYITSFEITQASTWQQVFLSVPFDTVSEGTWHTGSGTGLWISFVYNAGGNVRTSTPNTWQTTEAWAVQEQVDLSQTLDAKLLLTVVWLLPYTITALSGSSIPADPRSWGDDFWYTERYYENTYGAGIVPGSIVSELESPMSVVYSSGATNEWYVPFRRRKRANPTVTVYNPVTGAAGSVRNIDENSDHAVTVQRDSMGVRIATTAGGGAVGSRLAYHLVASARLPET